MKISSKIPRVNSFSNIANLFLTSFLALSVIACSRQESGQKNSSSQLSQVQKSAISSSSQIVDGGVYSMQVQSDKLYLSSNNNFLVQNTAVGNFIFRKVGSAYQIANQADGSCLAVNGSSNQTFAWLFFKHCSTSDSSQAFIFTAQSDGSFVVQRFSGSSGMCFDVPYASTSAGIQLAQYPCNYLPNEKILLTQLSVPVATPTATPTPAPVTGSAFSDGGVYTMQVQSDKLYLSNNNSALVQNTAVGKFIFRKNGSAYQIANQADGSCLAVNGSSNQTFAWLVFKSCSTSDASQSFIFTAQSDSSFVIQPFSGTTGMCFDVPYASTQAGNQLAQYPCNYLPNEKILIASASGSVAIPTPTPSPVATPVPAATPTPTPVPTTTGSSFTDGGIYSMQVQSDKLYLSRNNNALIQNSTVGKFVFRKSGSAYQISNQADGSCLAVNGSSNQTFAWLVFKSCSTSDASQSFIFKAQSDGSYVVQPFSGTTGMCFDVPYASTQAGNQLAQYPCNYLPNEKILIAAASGSTTSPTPAPTPVATPVPTPVPTPVANALPAPIANLNYVMTFDDEFTSLSSISNSSIWDGSKWYNGNEQCCLSNSTGSVGGGMYPSTYNGTQFYPYAIAQGGGLNLTAKLINNSWFSGVLTSVDQTGRGFSQQYGYFEIKTKLPAGAGTWPSFWMLSESCLTTRQNLGEVDIFESYGQDTSFFAYTVHDWSGGTTPANAFPKVLDQTKDFHKYGLLWTEQTTYLYFDDVLVYSHPTPSVMKQPYYLLIDLGIGGGWPTDQTPVSNTMQIQYVRAYAPAK